MIDIKIGSIEYLSRIVRSVPVGFGGYIIGKKGAFKSYLSSEFGAQLRLINDPTNNARQIIKIDCPEDQKLIVEKAIDEKISQIEAKSLNTLTSNPEQLKPIVQLGKLIPGYVMNMSFNNDMIVILDCPQSAVSYETMTKYINEEYNALSPKVPSPIGIGCICIALGSRAIYYRALILSYYYDIAHVYFVDIGKVELLPANRLFKIKVKFLNLPFRAVPVKWNNASLDLKIPNVEEVIYRRFFCGPNSKPSKCYFYFTHVSCCIPNLTIYMPKTGDEMSTDFVDVLELVSAIGLGQAVKSEILLSKNSRRLSTDVNDALYYKPCNFSFYEHLLEFKVDKSKPTE